MGCMRVRASLWKHCALSLSKTLNIVCLVLVQPRNECLNLVLNMVQPSKTHPDMTEKMLTGT